MMIKKLTAISCLLFTVHVFADDLRSVAEQALIAGDVEMALQAYVEILTSDPDDAEALEMSVLLAEEMGIAELALDLLVADVERAVARDEYTRIASGLAQLSAAGAVLPEWVDEQVARAGELTESQYDAFEVWQELNAESQLLMENGDFETAMTVAEGAMLIALESFGEDHWITAISMRDLGFAARQFGDAETADTYYSEALGIAMALLDEGHPETQYIATLLAELYTRVGAYDEALSILEMITAGYDTALGGSHSLTLASLISQAETYQAASNNALAIEVLAVACDAYSASRTRYHPETLNCLRQLARLHREVGDLDDAATLLTVINDSLQASTNGLSEMAIQNLLDLAEIAWARGDFAVAKTRLSTLALTAQQTGALELSFTAKNYLARVLGSEGDLDSAVRLAEDVTAYGRDAWMENPVQYFNALLELGGLYQRQSRFEEAEALFEEAMLAMLELGGEFHPTTLVAMNNLGNLYEQLGLYDDAEPVLKQTLEGMSRTFGIAHTQTARTRNNLALLHESQGNFREAEPLYNTSYEHLSDVLGADHPDAIGMKNNLAYLYMLMERYDEAAVMFEELVAQWTATLGADHQDALKSRNNLGRVYQKLDRLEEAESIVDEALSLRRASLGEDHIDTIRSRIDKGSIYLDQGRIDEAILQLQAALDSAEQVIGEQHPYTFEALNHLAKAKEAKGDVTGAIELRSEGLARRSVFLDRMLWVTGENAREGYIRVHRPELDEYLRLLVSSDDPLRGKKAIEASLQRKGLLLKITSEIEQISQLSEDPKLASLAASLESARKDLASLTLSGPTPETQGRHAEALYELEQRVNELQGELGRASVRYRSSIAGTSADLLEQVVPDNTAFVDFLMYDDNGSARALAGIITNDEGELEYDLVAFPDRAQIEDIVIEYREIIQDDLADEDEVLEIGQLAHELVWLPIEEALGGLDYVYLIPDGVLNILPFNALMNEDEAYLIQTTDVHILTSGRDLLPNDYELRDGEYVILAGPDYNSDSVAGEAVLAAAEGRRSTALQLGIRGAGSGLRGLNFAPLPGAEQEGRIITDKVAASDAQSAVFFGEQAQEQVLAAINEAPEILHMATHGFFLEADDTLRKRLLKMQRSAEVQVPPPGDNPLLRSGLAFAGINTNAQFLGDIDTVNDGVLTALEVLGLNLSGTRLVVLSACETGLGEIHEGEGVYGLRRSFQEAGVAEVVSSLWEVSDAGTQALMTDFYGRIIDGVPAREALRDTQLAMLDSPEWGYPYIWSAFMIVGSYESAGISIQ